MGWLPTIKDFKEVKECQLIKNAGKSFTADFASAIIKL